MSTITAIVEADANGTLHLAVPDEWRHGKIRVVATLEASEAQPGAASASPLEAFQELRKLGTIAELIPDPVAWQREQRRDRGLPGRE